MGNSAEITRLELANKLVNEKKDVNELNLDNLNQKKAFLQAIAVRPHLLEKVKQENEEKFFSVAIKDNYEYLIYLKRNQYKDEYVQTYLSNRLEKKIENKRSRADSEKMLAQKSLDEKVILNYNYATEDGEEFNYFDNELKVPILIKTNFSISLKIIDALAFIDKLDTDIKQLGANVVESVIFGSLGNHYKAFINKFIKENSIGYYGLVASCAEIEKGFIEKLNELYAEYGIVCKSLNIKGFAIPKEILYKIENQALQLRQRREEIEADDEFAKKSLKNYETKLSLEQKYPEAEHTLTEYEKDSALKRYLIKLGYSTEEQVDRSVNLKNTNIKSDEVLDKLEDLEIEPPKSKFAQTFYTLLVMCVIVAVIVMASASFWSGLIVLGIVTGIFGTVAAFNHKKLAKNQETEGVNNGRNE